MVVRFVLLAVFSCLPVLFYGGHRSQLGKQRSGEGGHARTDWPTNRRQNLQAAGAGAGEELRAELSRKW